MIMWFMLWHAWLWTMIMWIMIWRTSEMYEIWIEAVALLFAPVIVSSSDLLQLWRRTVRFVICISAMSRVVPNWHRPALDLPPSCWGCCQSCILSKFCVVVDYVSHFCNRPILPAHSDILCLLANSVLRMLSVCRWAVHWCNFARLL